MSYFENHDCDSCQDPMHAGCSRCNPMTPLEYKEHIIEKEDDGTVVWYPVNDTDDVSRAHTADEAKGVIDMIVKL